MNSTQVYGFGRLDWNITQNVSTSLFGATKWTNVGGAAVELTVILFFIVKFCIKKSGFREPYYFIYTIGCSVDAVPKILTLFNAYIDQNIVSLTLTSFFSWYNSNFIALWNLLLALNRFIAIFFSLDFSRIWSKRNTTIVILFLCLYPFLIHCFNPGFMFCQITGNYCPLSVKKSATATTFEIYFSYISDITYAIIATILCSAAAYNIFVKKRMQNQHVEKVLLVQSFTSSVFLILSTATSWLAFVNGFSSDPMVPMVESMRALRLQMFFNALSDFFYNIHHYVGLLLLIIASRIFQTKYFEFYRIDKLIKFLKLPSKPKVAAIPISMAPDTITVMPNRHVSFTSHR